MSGARRRLLALTAGVLLTAGVSPFASAQGNPDRHKPMPPAGAQPRPMPAPVPAEVHVLPVQGKVYMLVGAGGNITMQVGDDGILLVDSGLADTSEQVLAAVRSVSDRPIRYIISTHAHADHTGGNEAIAKAGRTIAGGNVVGDIGASAWNQAMIIAYQTVLERMSEPSGNEPAAPEGARPTETYTLDERKLYFNGEAIEIIHIPNAHTDGDSIVFFHKSDVISAGGIFNTVSYPYVDLQQGGNIQGLIAGLNRIIALGTTAAMEEGGTMVIPGHGRLCNRADVKFFQEMVTVIRDRIQDMIRKGMTLEQVKAARPTLDYDPRYGSETGRWTTDMFVETVYRSLTEKK